MTETADVKHLVVGNGLAMGSIGPVPFGAIPLIRNFPL